MSETDATVDASGAEALQTQREELARREQELSEREEDLRQRAKPADAPDEAPTLDRDFIAKSPGTRKGGRNPWVLLSLLGLCAVAMYFVIVADTEKKRHREDEKPAVFETVKPRAKVVPGKEEEPTVPPVADTEDFNQEPPAPTREDLERRKELEEKRKQAEALRLARIKSAILVAGGEGAFLSPTAAGGMVPGASSEGDLGAFAPANIHGSNAASLPTSGSVFSEEGSIRGNWSSASSAQLSSRNDGPSADPNERFFAEKSGRTRPGLQAIQLNDLAHTVLQGKLVDCVLETAIQSDLPGQLRCSTSNDVYAESGRAVMLPAKTRMIGQYNSALRKGQVRVFVIWQRAITPDGVDIQLDSPGTDALGRAGVGGEVDNHYLEIFGVSAMLSIIGAGASSYGVGGVDQPNSEAAYRQAIQQSFAQTAQQILSPYAQIAPTIHVNQGEAIKIFVNRDLDFSRVYAARPDAKPSYTVIQ
jgi:type IV secretory pathway VirB10-like protein